MNLIKNKIYLFTVIFFIFSFFNINNVFSYSCEYKSEIERCIGAQNGKEKSIEDFVCITGNRGAISYQIVLDMEFKEIDDKMDLYLENLEKNKNKYFGIGAQKNYIDGINDVHDMGDTFTKEYKSLCTSVILGKALVCSSDKVEEQKVTIDNAIKYFNNNGTSCKKLIEKKISIYKDVAFGVLMLNKEQIKADEKKTYDQGQRSNYDHLLDIMMINLGYIERIWQKWPSKLANPY